MTRVGVVGAGVMGLATAYALARRGAEVDVYEQFRIGHARGSSHGDARIFRLAYADERYVPDAIESLPLWRELEAETGEAILRTTGSLDVGEELPHLQALDAHGVPYERLTARHVRERFGIRTESGGILQADGGVLHAERAQRAFASRAAAAGARIHEETRVTDLDAVEADAVVVTAGAWVNDFGFDLPVRVTRETFGHFDVGRATPTIIDWEPATLGTYALPVADGLLKVGLHHHGHEADPDREEDPNAELLAGAREWVERRFGVAPEAQRPDTCLYTTTPDERFVLERRGRYVIGSPCSGHGFKFAPLLGRRLAALALA